MEATGLIGYEGKDKNKKQIHKRNGTLPHTKPGETETTLEDRNDTSESERVTFRCVRLSGWTKGGRERTETEEIGGVF